MPLVSDGKSRAVAHDNLRAIGFWMTVKGAKPVQPVRVFVTYEALAGLDSTNIRDLAAAFEHFDEYRKRIEAAASAKFDRAGTDAVDQRLHQDRAGPRGELDGRVWSSNSCFVERRHFPGACGWGVSL